MKDTASHPTVLVFGGTPGDRSAMDAALSSRFDCLSATTLDDAAALMGEHFVQVAVCAGDGSGTSCWQDIEEIRGRWPETLFVLVGADWSEASGASFGIQNVLGSDWTATQLQVAVSAAVRTFRLGRENERMALERRYLGPAGPSQRRPRGDLGFEDVIRTAASPMNDVVAAARQVASFDVPVLLTGEPGTGRACLAKAIHAGSLRSDQPFFTLDAAGLSEAAIELLLFGRRRPGNGHPPVNKPGLLRKADQGTVHIDGVEHLPRPIQLRLLRLLREGEFETSGASDLETSRVRLVASTGPDPRKAISEGLLDIGFYYALSVAELALPPLRDRTCDIPVIARDMAEEAGRVHGKAVHGLSEAALGFLRAYPWPGNLHELENEIVRMLIRSQEAELGADVVSRHILQAQPGRADAREAQIMTATGPLKDRIESIEARILVETLTRLKWNKSRSAAELGLSRVGLRAKLDRYGIAPPMTEEA